MSRARSLRAVCIGLGLTLASSAPSWAGGVWGPVTLLDPRPPLEFGPPLEGVDLDGRAPFAVLFQSIPELVLGRFLPGPGAPSVDVYWQFLGDDPSPFNLQLSASNGLRMHLP